VLTLSVSSIPLFSFRVCRVTLLSLKKDASLQGIPEGVHSVCRVRGLSPLVSSYVLSIDFPLETDENVPIMRQEARASVNRRKQELLAARDESAGSRQGCPWSVD
jgi:hypothetical protein